MGVILQWQEEVWLAVQNLNAQATWHTTEPYPIIAGSSDFFIHLIPLVNSLVPADLIALQLRFQAEGKQLVHLWEDVWLFKKSQVLSRFRSFLGQNKSFHGRKAKVMTITQKEAIQFLNQHHLQGYVRAKYSFGLVADEELIAVASFSAPRPMKSKGEHYQSAELVRFASTEGLTIVGGLSKLIKHFIKQVKINDLMTYADRDWSLGKGYDKLGFTLSGETGPAWMFVNTTTGLRYFSHRLPKNLLLAFEAQNVLNLEEFLHTNAFIKVFNTGNLKYHFYL